MSSQHIEKELYNKKPDIGNERKIMINTIIGLAIMFLFKYLPTPEGLPQAGMQLIGITFGALYLWTTVSIGWPSFACIFALSTTGVMKYNEVISSTLGSWIIMFLICCFLVSYSLVKTGVARRIAIWFITRPLAKKSPWLLIAMFNYGILFLTMFLSGITTLAIGLPIAEQIIRQLGYEKEKRDLFPQILILGVAFCACIGQGMTPVGASTVMLGLSILNALTGQTISFASYMAFGIPAGILTCTGFLLFFRYIVKPDVSRLKNFNVDEIVGEQKPTDLREKISALTYLVVFIAWIIPSLLKDVAPDLSAFLSSMGTVGPILLAVVFLAVVRIDGEPLLDVKEGLKEGVGWSGLFLVGAVLALSTALGKEGAGIITYLTNAGQPLMSNLSPLAFIILVTTLAGVMTNIVSNNITISVLTNLGIALALTSGVSPALVTVLIVCIANYAFATPAATLQMTMVAGSGWVDTTKMIKYGVATMIIGIIVMIAVAIPIARMLF